MPCRSKNIIIMPCCIVLENYFSTSLVIVYHHTHNAKIMYTCISFLSYATSIIHGVFYPSHAELNVTITVSYTPAPDEAPGELAANEFTAASALSLTCMVQGASGSLSYSWSVEGNPDTPSRCSCDPLTLNTDIQNFWFLPSYYAGIYTCSVSESDRSGSENSDSYTIRVVGTLCMECVCSTSRLSFSCTLVQVLASTLSLLLLDMTLVP